MPGVCAFAAAVGGNGLLKRFVKAVLERALNAELTHHPAYARHDPAGNISGDSRNGASSKTAKGISGDYILGKTGQIGYYEDRVTGLGLPIRAAVFAVLITFRAMLKVRRLKRLPIAHGGLVHGDSVPAVWTLSDEALHFLFYGERIGNRHSLPVRNVVALF